MTPDAAQQGWLIERGQQEGELVPHWYLAKPYPAQGEWVTDANKATRFASFSEAESCIGDRGLVFCRATEHLWMGVAPKPTDHAYRERMEALMQDVTALLREYGLFRCEWSCEGTDFDGRLIRHRISVTGYEKKRAMTQGGGPERVR
jgi:hypothetical protein